MSDKLLKKRLADLKEPDNEVRRFEFVGEMTVEEAIELLRKTRADKSGKEYRRTIAAFRDPNNPTLIGFSVVEATS